MRIRSQSLLLLLLHATGTSFGFQAIRPSPSRPHTLPPRHDVVRLWSRDPSSRGQGFGKPSSSDRGPAEPQSPNTSSDGPLAGLSEERRANLFQTLLRDLQIEGVPLLGVDARQVHTFQAAVWTVLAELCDQPLEQKACLVFEYIPVHALQPFVDDFMILKTQQLDKIQHLPEVERVSLSLVGKGVGPAILVEVSNATSQHSLADTVRSVSDEQCRTAIQAFLQRLVVAGEPEGAAETPGVCPHVASTDEAPARIPGTPPQSIEFKTCSKPDVFHILSSFWNSICELYASDNIGTMLLSLPSLGMSTDVSMEANHARFANVAELMSRYLCLYKGDGVYELLHFHPLYTRALVSPEDQPAHGHLPPTSWLRSMLRLNGNLEAADQLSDADLACSNYQRRAPVPAVCIKRVEHLEQATALDPASGVVQMAREDGSVVQASGVPTYARNTIRLASMGESALQQGLEQDMRGLL